MVVRHLFTQRETPKVYLEEVDWMERFEEFLNQSGVVNIFVHEDNRERLGTEIVNIISNPINVGAVQLNPVVQSVNREGRYYVVSIILREHL